MKKVLVSLTAAVVFVFISSFAFAGGGHGGDGHHGGYNENRNYSKWDNYYYGSAVAWDALNFAGAVRGTFGGGCYNNYPPPQPYYQSQPYYQPQPRCHMVEVPVVDAWGNFLGYRWRQECW